MNKRILDVVEDYEALERLNNRLYMTEEQCCVITHCILKTLVEMIKEEEKCPTQEQ